MDVRSVLLDVERDVIKQRLNINHSERDKLVGLMGSEHGKFLDFCETKLRSLVKNYVAYLPKTAYNNAVNLQPLIEMVGFCFPYLSRLGAQLLTAHGLNTNTDSVSGTRIIRDV